MVDIKFPEAYLPMFQPCRYKILRSGRGAAKSHTVAGALVLLSAKNPLRILCARETQKSIADSVLRLIEDKIDAYNMRPYFRITQTSIVGIDPKTGKETGTEFLFHGLKHNISNIKSLEGVDIVWVEEAQSVSYESWETLIPTIRNENCKIYDDYPPCKSEIWITFNPGLESDDTYQRFVVHPPEGALSLSLSWRDNPWFPQVLRDEMEHLKATDYDAYLHVWEGHCKRNLEGSIYANELRAVEAEGRICRVPYDPLKGVQTFWDLGRADATAIWFVQAIAFEYRIIEYFESSGHDINYYIKQIQNRKYRYDTHWLPHDARAKQLGSGRSIEEQLVDAGMNIRIVPRLSIIDGINATRILLQKCWFDEEKTKDGMQALRNYRWREPSAKEKALNISAWEPEHSWASHCADALRMCAVAVQEPERKRKESAQPPVKRYWGAGGDSWMG